MGLPSIHRTVSTDGTEIVGRVEGAGPPLVLIHGGLGDGETTWVPLVPFLQERFTCVTMSTRGRGLSQDAADHSIQRLVEDVTWFVESIGEPAGVIGQSSGALLALAAAAGTKAVTRVAAWEPNLAAAITPTTAPADPTPFLELVEQGQLSEAVRLFFERSGLFSDEEVAAMATADAFEALEANVPTFVQELAGYDHAVDDAVLGELDMPVLLLHGSRTAAWYRDSVAYLAQRLPDPAVTEIPGAGHLGPALAPERVADELTRFFDGTHNPSPTTADLGPKNLAE